MQDWSFATKPKWLLSHLFVGSLIAIFIWAGFWQLSRLEDRKAQNEIVLSRADAPALTVADALAAHSTPDKLDYVRVEDVGRWLDDEFVRVANRSQGGLGGDWQVGTFETNDGVIILVNRGFLNRDAEGAPGVDGEISGWLQISRLKEGYFGVADTGEGERVPRLNVEALTERAGGNIAPVWLRLDGPTGTVPEPVPLPPVDEGAHFSYAVQWFIFATLSVIVYGLRLRKRAGERPA